MVEDLEVGVRLVPDTSELDDIEDREIGVSGAGATDGAGGGGAGDAASGGFAGAELGELLGPGAIIVGILAAVLSQIKIVAQFTGLIFRILGRALLPAIQLLVVALRPLLTQLAQTSAALGRPDQVLKGANRQLAQDLGVQPNQTGQIANAAGSGIGFLTGDVSQGPEAIGDAATAIESVLSSQKSTADHTDEDQKNLIANTINDVIDQIP